MYLDLAFDDDRRIQGQFRGPSNCPGADRCIFPKEPDHKIREPIDDLGRAVNAGAASTSQTRNQATMRSRSPKFVPGHLENRESDALRSRSSRQGLKFEAHLASRGGE